MGENKLIHLGLLVMRLIVGAIFCYYGSQKLFGAFGGAGFNGTLDWMKEAHGIPPALAALAIFAEFFGGLGVLFGFLTRLAGFGLVCTMAVAAYTKFQGLDLYAPSTVQSAGFPLSLLGMNLMLTCVGAGKVSLDWKLSRKNRKSEAA